MPKGKLLGLSFPVLGGIILVILALVIIGLLAGPIGKSLFPNLAMPAWLSVPRPAPKLPSEEVFSLFGWPITNTVIAAWLTVVVTVVFSFVVTRRMKIVPGKVQAVFEFLLGWVYGLCQSIAGEKHGRVFFPVIATIFLFVLFNAWLSLLPGFVSIEIVNPEGHTVELLRAANTDVNTPLAIALVSFVFVEFFGLKTLGVRYLRKFINAGQFFRSLGGIFRGRAKGGLMGLFSGAIDIFVGALEALSELIRIISFTFRLFGNMTAGEILILIAAFLIPLGIDWVVYGLELLIGFVQALIFAGLTLVFATMAVSPHEEESH